MIKQQADSNSIPDDLLFLPQDNVIGNIMIVDDSPPNLRMLSIMLTEEGHKVRCVTNGSAALTAISLMPPDLILLDINMPGMNGYEICQQLKRKDGTRDVPVIFISAINDVLDKVKAFSIGGVDYITKPFQMQEVSMRVQTHLRLRTLQKNLQSAIHELRRQVTLDGLTRIANRRRFDECLQDEWRRMIRDKKPLSLLLCDIDYFKSYNDTYGHQAGDNCLKMVAQTMDETVKRASDLVARYGGEEFGIVLPCTDQEGAKQVAHDLGKVIRELKIPHEQSSVADHVTMSIGVAMTWPATELNMKGLISAADEALYEAKANGRNQFVCRLYEAGTSPGFKQLVS